MSYQRGIQMFVVIELDRLHMRVRASILSERERSTYDHPHDTFTHLYQF